MTRSDTYVEFGISIKKKGLNIVNERKNWLFSFTEKGTTAACAYCSIMKTAIGDGLDSERYLEFLFTEFESKPIKDVEPCLAWSEEMRKGFKI